MLRGIYIIDADNTLWNTNEVFMGAQMEMIRALQECGCGLAEETALPAIRTMDPQIAVALNDFEYDFSRLACALLLLDRGCSGTEAVCLATTTHPPSEVWTAAQRAGSKFHAYVEATCPPLFNGVPETLQTLREQGNVLVLHSEGQRDRVLRTLAAHTLEPLFDTLALERKSRDSFQRAREAGERLFRGTTGQNPAHCIVVGDSPKRDIRFGNLIGAVTVFKPGGWLGAEIPDEPLLIPDYTIDCFEELLELGENKDLIALRR